MPHINVVMGWERFLAQTGEPGSFGVIQFCKDTTPLDWSQIHISVYLIKSRNKTASFVSKATGIINWSVPNNGTDAAMAIR